MQSRKLLPLSDSVKISKVWEQDTERVGISEVSDAFTVVVSEETGDVSVTFDVNYEIYPMKCLKNYLLNTGSVHTFKERCELVC